MSSGAALPQEPAPFIKSNLFGGENGGGGKSVFCLFQADLLTFHLSLLALSRRAASLALPSDMNLLRCQWVWGGWVGGAGVERGDLSALVRDQTKEGQRWGVGVRFTKAIKSEVCHWLLALIKSAAPAFSSAHFSVLACFCFLSRRRFAAFRRALPLVSSNNTWLPLASKV